MRISAFVFPDLPLVACELKAFCSWYCCGLQWRERDASIKQIIPHWAGWSVHVLISGQSSIDGMEGVEYLRSLILKHFREGCVHSKYD